MTAYTQTVSISSASALTTGKTIASTYTQRWLFHEGLSAARVFLRTLTQNLTGHQADVEQWKWGRTLSQAISAKLTQVQKATYHVVDVDVIRLAQALQRAYPVTLTQNLTAHQATAAALAVIVLQRLNLIPAQTQKATYHLALAQQISTHDALLRFFGAALTQNLTVHAAPAVTYVAKPTLAQNLTVHAALANKLVLQITSTFDLSPAQIPRMIYSGDKLLDKISITGLYVLPDGTVTTWAINTRTNAITEYMNYDFNSFAQLGAKHIAANSGGIYELDGDTDAGAAIVAEVQSGLARLNGTKLTGLKGAYIAMRGGGRFYLKIIAGDGREYLYEAVAQPGLMTTKINVGKGLRTSYIAFNLQSEGQDFDLDGLEFVPMISDRRV